jgi:hypothetical protein
MNNWNTNFYKYVMPTSTKIPKQPVTTEYSGLMTSDDIVDASTYLSRRRSNWINRSKYAIYIVLLVFAIILISKKTNGWSEYWKQFKSSLSGTLLNVFSVMLLIDVLSVWVIDLTFMRGVEYTYSARFMANEWKPVKQIDRNSDTYIEMKNTCPGLHKYGRFSFPSLNV